MQKSENITMLCGKGNEEWACHLEQPSTSFFESYSEKNKSSAVCSNVMQCTTKVFCT
jgi:hypothetical protein